VARVAAALERLGAEEDVRREAAAQLLDALERVLA
jgi:hypothetical protein